MKVELKIAIKACMSCKHFKQEVSGYSGSYSLISICWKHRQESGVGLLHVPAYTICKDYEPIEIK